jgi:hypothetical protein
MATESSKKMTRFPVEMKTWKVEGVLPREEKWRVR